MAQRRPSRQAQDSGAGRGAGMGGSRGGGSGRLGQSNGNGVFATVRHPAPPGASMGQPARRHGHRPRRSQAPLLLAGRVMRACLRQPPGVRAAKDGLRRERATGQRRASKHGAAVALPAPSSRCGGRHLRARSLSGAGEGSAQRHSSDAAFSATGEPCRPDVRETDSPEAAAVRWLPVCGRLAPPREIFLFPLLPQQPPQALLVRTEEEAIPASTTTAAVSSGLAICRMS